MLVEAITFFSPASMWQPLNWSLHLHFYSFSSLLHTSSRQTDFFKDAKYDRKITWIETHLWIKDVFVNDPLGSTFSVLCRHPANLWQAAQLYLIFQRQSCKMEKWRNLPLPCYRVMSEFSKDKSNNLHSFLSFLFFWGAGFTGYIFTHKCVTLFSRHRNLRTPLLQVS